MPKIGETIGRFTLERELGRGPAPGEVFLGVEQTTSWKVAVEGLPPRAGLEVRGPIASWAQRMLREATRRPRSLVGHEHVIRVHEVGEQQGAPYLVRDFIEGKSLVEHIGDRSNGAFEQKLRWLHDLARTLSEIHEAGLVHRDVKPSIVLIRRDGAARRLIDFGVARRSVDREAGIAGQVADKLPSGTERLRVVGTPAYMAPERFAHQTTSPAADQFGWGVLAYELFAGRLPWGRPEDLPHLRPGADDRSDPEPKLPRVGAAPSLRVSPARNRRRSSLKTMAKDAGRSISEHGLRRARARRVDALNATAGLAFRDSGAEPVTTEGQSTKSPLTGNPGTFSRGKYQVERVLGEGAMGFVVAAMHVHLGERVALKFLKPELAGNPEVVARFLREAQSAVRIKGEHVARVSDVGTLEGGAPYMVMEYLTGSDLGQLVEQRGKLDVAQAVDCVIQACDALAEAHALGIVHRDLKPANLFLTRSARTARRS